MNQGGNSALYGIREIGPREPGSGFGLIFDLGNKAECFPVEIGPIARFSYQAARVMMEIRPYVANCK